jgi:hypothetical protein
LPGVVNLGCSVWLGVSDVLVTCIDLKWMKKSRRWIDLTVAPLRGTQLKLHEIMGL